MDGILNVLKPPGMTSHDVVAHLRRVLGEKKIGHTGTLDPGAAGVLVALVGRATRIAEYLAEDDKAYRVEMRLGVATDTGDAYGTVTATREVHATAEQIRAAAAALVGPLDQVPPMASAVKVGGRPLYQHRLRGEEVERAPRRVTIHALEVLAAEGDRALLDLTCSKGTYVRTLVADLGETLGCGAHVSFLVRTRAGAFRLEESATLEEIHEAARAGAPPLWPMDRALAAMPAVEVEAPQRAALMSGKPLPLWKVSREGVPEAGTLVRIRDRAGRLLAVGRVEAGVIRSEKVLA